MCFSGLLALSALLVQLSAPHDGAAPQAQSVDTASQPSVWQGGAVARCPEDLRFEGRTLPLIEVPETATQLAHQADAGPGRLPAARPPAPCIAPADR